MLKTQNDDLNRKLEYVADLAVRLSKAIYTGNTADFEDLSYIMKSQVGIVISLYEEAIEREEA
jgi:hypothetical protein